MRYVTTTALLVLFATTVFAQALPNITSLGVRYNTVKNAAHAQGELKTQLDEIDRAIAEARRITSRGALARQYQYLGKLMRNEDVPAIEAALDAQVEAQKARARLRK